MFLLLRRLREKLLKKNQVTMYLAYAVGEIILVVIGILIALQIDTWNDEAHNRILENSYYCRLLEDVRQDELQVNRLIDESINRIAGGNRMLAELQKDKFDIDSVVNYNLQVISLITFTFKPSLAAFEDLKSSGNLNIIRDNEVKSAIITYYSTLQGIVDVIDTNADGSVALFYDKDDYSEAMWHRIRLTSTDIDTSKVDLKKLDPVPFDIRKFRKNMTSDAIFHTSVNTRIKYLYESILPTIAKMIRKLENKCG